MRTYYLAVDIGASSGRHMLAWMEDGRIQLEEIYRFPNGMKQKNGTLCWDIKALFDEIKNGLRKCGEYMRSSPSQSCMQEPEFKSRFLIQSIS